MARYNWSTCSVIDSDHPLRGPGYLAYVRKLKRIAIDNGIECNQSHAPFPVLCKEIRDLLKRSIECTAEAEGKICVIHPDCFKTAEENAEMYLELLPFAKEHGVKLATENMWDWSSKTDCASPVACSTHEDFAAHIKAVNDPYLIACLDIGHAEMRGLGTSSVEMIRTLGDSLGALHIHDNDLWKDRHALPFTMDIDFGKVIKELKAIDYKGELTLEADSHMKSFTEENAFEGVKIMADTAKKLAEMYEEA